MNEPVCQAKVRVLICANGAGPIWIADDRQLAVLDASESEVFFRLLDKMSVASFTLRFRGVSATETDPS